MAEVDRKPPSPFLPCGSYSFLTPRLWLHRYTGDGGEEGEEHWPSSPDTSLPSCAASGIPQLALSLLVPSAALVPPLSTATQASFPHYRTVYPENVD